MKTSHVFQYTSVKSIAFCSFFLGQKYLLFPPQELCDTKGGGGGGGQVVVVSINGFPSLGGRTAF